MAPAATAKLYRAATDSPLYEPLRDLVEKTLGVELALKDALAALNAVEAAAIYGSWAGGHLRLQSDIDVLVVGDVAFDDVADAVRQVEQLAGREVGITLFTRSEFEHNVRADSGFASTLVSREFKPLVGDPERLRG